MSKTMEDLRIAADEAMSQLATAQLLARAAHQNNQEALAAADKAVAAWSEAVSALATKIDPCGICGKRPREEGSGRCRPCQGKPPLEASQSDSAPSIADQVNEIITSSLLGRLETLEQELLCSVCETRLGDPAFCRNLECPGPE